MAYTINLTNGTIFAVVADGTINTSSSMTLVGQNYAGYGAFLDTNFVHLLENASNTTPPGAPLTGQLWWDSGNNLLKVYNGSTFKPMSSNTASSSAPTGNVTGDLWFNTSTQQLNVWTGSAWLVVGPGSNTPGGTTGAGYMFSSTANFGVFFGSGVPTLSAAKGSLYLRTDGTTTNDRMYVNTNGSTTWTAVTTVA
jgi:hypothetical protein